MTINTEDLRIIEGLGVDPSTVLAGSVEVHRFTSGPKEGQPYLVTYTSYVTEPERLAFIDAEVRA